MYRLFAIVGVAYSMATLCLAADLSEAQRILGAKPKEALSLARAALATDPHDVEAHKLAVKALKLLGRVDEAIAPLEAWSAEAPNAFPPLWILLDVRTWLKDWSSVPGLAARAPVEPEAERRKFLWAIAFAALEHDKFSEAASVLLITPAPPAGDPFVEGFAALAASAAGEWSEDDPNVRRFLTSGVKEETQTRFLWWTAELARIAGPSTRRGEKSVAGGGVGGVVDGKKTDPNVPIVPTGTFQLPILKRKVEPLYPEEARVNRIEGKVTVQTVVLTTGHAAYPTILASSNPIFNEAARKAIVGWRFEPARVDGQPVAIYYTILVTFKL